MRDKIDGIIFDWAGTTVDYGCFAPVCAFLKSFEEAGIELTLEEIRGPMGMAKKIISGPYLKCRGLSSFGNISITDDVERLYKRFEEILVPVLSEFTEPLPGVIETVEILREKGIKIGSTTGYINKMMELVAKGAFEKGTGPIVW